MTYAAFYPVRTCGKTTGVFSLLDASCLSREQIASLCAGNSVTVGQETYVPAVPGVVTVLEDGETEIRQPDLNAVFTPVVMSVEALRLLSGYQAERSYRAGRWFSVSDAVIDAVKSASEGGNDA